jgi:hypothetical protein
VKKTSFVILLCLSISALQGAEVAPLKLSDGRVFENWKVTGSSAQSVVIRYKGGLAQIPKSLLPEPLASQYPINAAQVMADEAAAAESRRMAKARELELSDARKLRLEQTAVPIHSNRSRNAGTAVAGDQSILEIVSETARNGAIRYFKYEFDPSARNRAWSIKVDIEADAPEQWAGYPGRYTVKGKAYVGYYDWYWTSTTRQTTKEYTVFVDVSGSTAKVTEVRTW